MSDTARQLKTAGATVGIVAAALSVGIYVANVTVPPGPLPVTTFEAVTITRPLPLATNKPRVRYSWRDYLSPEDARAGWVTDFYGTTNLRAFYYVGSTTSNAATLPASLAFEGFVTRHRHTNSGLCTPWNVKR